jgi:FkbM family methyltransferase
MSNPNEIQAVSARLQAEQKKIKALNEYLQSEQDKIRKLNHSLQEEQNKIRKINEQLLAQQDALLASVDFVQTGEWPEAPSAEINHARLNLPPFDSYLLRARPEARLAKFQSRFPFALDRGPEAKRLHQSDPNSPLGHEPELSHLIDRLVPDDGVYLDVGSNYGYFSIYLATRPGFHGRIHAFEPIASSFAGLRDLVMALRCDDSVTCHNAAVSDQIGTATMAIGDDPGLASIKDGAFANGEVVKTITLDSLNLDRVDFMKIDVEEHEAAALRGADALIAKHQPYIYLESWSFDNDSRKVFEPLKFMLDRGYRLYLPAWAQSNGSFFVGVGAGYEMDKFALLPFSLIDRLTFPGNPINIFAAPVSRQDKLGVRWAETGGKV